jgi:hypothetical protein
LGTPSLSSTAILFERAIVDFAASLDVQHQFSGGVAGVHQDGAEGQLFVFDGMVEDLSHVVEFGFAIHVGSKQTIVDEPKLVGLGVNINRGDNPDAFDHRTGIARILPPQKFNGKRVVFVGHRVIKEQLADGRGDKRIFDLLPNQAWFEFVIAQKAIQLVVTKLLMVVGKISQRIIDLTAEQVLAVIKACERCFIGNEHSERLLGFSTLA